nr:MAG TPA: hypothetical protein [Caudoviricetes sp.]
MIHCKFNILLPIKSNNSYIYLLYIYNNVYRAIYLYYLCTRLSNSYYICNA